MIFINCQSGGVYEIVRITVNHMSQLSKLIYALWCVIKKFKIIVIYVVCNYLLFGLLLIYDYNLFIEYLVLRNYDPLYNLFLLCDCREILRNFIAN